MIPPGMGSPQKSWAGTGKINAAVVMTTAIANVGRTRASLAVGAAQLHRARDAIMAGRMSTSACHGIVLGLGRPAPVTLRMSATGAGSVAAHHPLDPHLLSMGQRGLGVLLGLGPGPRLPLEA